MDEKEATIYTIPPRGKVDFQKEKVAIEAYSKTVSELQKKLVKYNNEIEKMGKQGLHSSNEYKEMINSVKDGEDQLRNSSLMLKHHQANVEGVEKKYKSYTTSIKDLEKEKESLQKQMLGMSTADQEDAKKKIENIDKVIKKVTDSRAEYAAGVNFFIEGQENVFTEIAEKNKQEQTAAQQAIIKTLKEDAENKKAIFQSSDLEDAPQRDVSVKLKELEEYQSAELKSLQEQKKITLSNKQLTADEIKEITEKSNKDIEALNKYVFEQSVATISNLSEGELSEFKKLTENRLSLAKEGSAEELKLKVQNILIQQQMDLDAAKTEEEAALVQRRVNAEMQELQNTILSQSVTANAEANAQKLENDTQTAEKKKEIVNQSLAAEKSLIEAQKTGLASFYSEMDFSPLFKFEEAQIKAQQAEEAYMNALMDSESIGAMTAETQANLDVLKTNAEMAKLGVVDAGLGMAQDVGIGISNVLETTSTAFDAWQNHSTAVASLSRGMAIYDIALDTGRAIAKGVAAAQAIPFPGNIPAIATTIASIMANVVQAKKLVQSVAQPKKDESASGASKLQYKFKASGKALGGLITGPGSGTSDSIHTMLSNGESVLSAKATSMFSPILSAFNQLGGGVPISTSNISNNISAEIMGEEMLSRALSKAIEKIPNPVVSVEEINNTMERVRVLERYRTL